MERLFRSASFRTQSLLFASFVQVGLGWLEEKDFRRVDRDMTSLGMRHVSYGVHPSHLCVFQLALPLGFLETPSLGRAPLKKTQSYTAYTRHTATRFGRPLWQVEGFVQSTQGPGAGIGDGLERGLASLYCHPLHAGAPDHGGDREEGSSLGRSEICCSRQPATRASCLAWQRNLNNVPGGEHNWSSSVFRDAAHELSHMGILVSFIQDTAAARTLRPSRMNPVCTAVHA